MTWQLQTGAVAARVPGYEILHAAGRGSGGRVFVARQTALDRLVALKFLAIDPDADPEERRARFRREAAIMAGLSHPHVLTVHEYGEAEDRPYLVLEYIEGGDLRRLMPEGRPMPEGQVMPILRPVAEALSYLHGEEVLHRDLKPENILIGPNGKPKVADFGIAVDRAESGDLTGTDQGLGTLGYVAPEQQYRLPVDERADQYSLAAMAYEMLTGRRALGLLRPPSHHNPALPREADAAILRGLEEEPSARFGSVLEFIEALGTALQAPRRRKPRAVLIPAMLAFLAGLVAIGLAIAPRTRPEPVPGTAPVVPGQPRKPGPVEPAADRAARDRARLTEHVAHQLWIMQGSPIDEEGEAVAKLNYLAAMDETEMLINERAFLIWERHNKPEGTAMADQEEAVRELLAECGPTDPPAPPEARPR